MAESRIEQIDRRTIRWSEQERKHFGQVELAELAETIRVHGILEPIGVVQEEKGYRGLWGERRWRAAELAGLDLVPAIVRAEPRDASEIMEIRLIENINRENLRPTEAACGLDQLMKSANLTASAVARRVGMKPAAVSKALSLLSLPNSIQQQIDRGEISASAGYELAKIEDPAVQAQLAEQAAAGALDRDTLAKRARGGGKRVTRAQHHSRVVARIGGGRQIAISAPELSVESITAALEELLNRFRSARGKNYQLRTLLRMLADEAKERG